MKNKKDFWDKYFPFIITAAYLILGIILITRHEYWFDEIHAWVKASRSTSIPELVSWVRTYEGAPFTWHFILYFLSHFISDNLESMKVVHLALSTVSAFLILKYFPFGKIYRILIVFGYYFFYQYSIISRNYVLGVLLVIVFCILYRNKFKNLIPLGVVLFLICQTNYYTFMIALSFTLILILDFAFEFKKIEGKKYLFHFGVVLVLVLIGTILFFWQIGYQLKANIPSFGESMGVGGFASKYYRNIIATLNGIILAYVPILKIDAGFFNSSFIANLSIGSRFRYVFPISFIFFIAPIFIIKRRQIIPYILGFTGMIIMPLFIHTGYIWHYGNIFLFFIVLLWLTKLSDKDSKYLIKVKVKYLLKAASVILIIFLVIAIIGTGIIFYSDYKYPFANGKYVAEYLEDNYDIDEIIIAGHWDWSAAATVSAYLDKLIYCPQEKDYIKFIPWNSPNRQRIMTDDEIFSDVSRMLAEKDTVVLMLNHKPDPEVAKLYGAEEVKYFEKSITGYEYYIYELGSSN